MNGVFLPSIYLLLSLVVAFCAIGRRPGFLLTLVLSVVVTPFVMLLVLHLTRPQPQSQPPQK